MCCVAQSTATLADGRVFTVGGSWGDAENLVPKNGEVFDLSSGWSPRPGCKVCAQAVPLPLICSRQSVGHSASPRSPHCTPVDLPSQGSMHEL